MTDYADYIIKGCTCNVCGSYRRKKWGGVEHGERKRWLHKKGATRGNLTLEEAYALVEAAKG